MASVYPANALLPQSGSIVARWLLDEASGNRADIGGSGNTLTDQNTVGVATGLILPNYRYDNSADFIAANSEYLSAADAAWNSITGAFTIAAWINADGVGSFQEIVAKFTESGNQRGYRLAKSSAAVYSSVSVDGTTNTENSGGTVAAGTWTHVVFVYEPSVRMENYFNGNSVATNTTSIPASIPNGTGVFTVGADNGTPATPANFFDGAMQDIVIWTAALTDAEVATLYSTFTQGVFGAPIFFT